MKAQERADKIFKTLRGLYPEPRTALRWSNPLELTVAAMLSAQSADVKVNEVTESLFKKYRTAADYAGADPAQLEADIHATGFFKQKAARLRAVAAALVDRHGGEVPAHIEALTALPGIGRKTANLILGDAFGAPGIVVDTHVKRLAGRWALTARTDPDKIELDLQKLLPRREWTLDSHRMILFGRETCQAKKPRCADCPVAGFCPWPDRERFA